MSLLYFILYRIYCPQWFYQHFAAHICPNMFNIFVLWNLLHPIIDIFERFPVGNIINHHNSVSSFIVGWCYGSKTVLACSVPLNINIDSYYLHSYFLPIYFCTFHFLRVSKDVQNPHQLCCRKQWWSYSPHNALTCRISLHLNYQW